MEDFSSFWVLVQDVWTNGVAGIDVGRWLGAGGILIGFLLVRRLFTRIALRWIKSIVAKTQNTVDDIAVETLEQPIRFVPVVMGAFFAIQYLQLDGIYYEIAENVVRSLIAFTIFWGILELVKPLSRFLHRLEAALTQELIEWLVKAIRIAVIAVGLATILQIWGIQVGPIIAGAGLFGVAVALGAQDLFKNLIAGILIIGEKRFRKGDWIRVDGVVEGTVENIGFRSTMVRQFDMAPVMVPNAKLADTPVTNFSAMTHRRIFWKIGVEYRTTVDQLRAIRDRIEAYITESADFVPRDQASMFVRIDSFNASSIDIMLYCFTHTTRWGEWLAIKEQLAYEIKRIVEDAGTNFAFPSQSVYIEAMPSERPDVFVPPGQDTD